MDMQLAGTLKSSKTATIPYPTHQAIATPASSLGRGDWGLKRPLPLKSTKSTSKPVLRLLANDTIEHITDFDSAQDHVQTLQKWTEMSVALSSGGKRERDPSMLTVGQKGVFERLTDSTDPKDNFDPGWRPVAETSTNRTNIRTTAQGRRWKFQGPWLASLDASEFARYIRRTVASRRTEFEQYIAEYIREKVVRARRDEATRTGRDLDTISNEVSDDDLKVHYRLFRQELQNLPITSELVEKIIIPFLDLPPVPLDAATQMSSPIVDQYVVGHNSEPLTTHPSAGLSYLRSNAHIYNHHLLGPQQYKKPVAARVLMPAKTNFGGRGRAVLGVAGVAVDDAETQSKMGAGSFNATNSVARLDTETEGGKKLWVSPTIANITPDGKIKLEITRAALDAIAVGLGQLEEAPPPGVKKAPSIMPLGGARLNEPLA